jgi:hypothetical protein
MAFVTSATSKSLGTTNAYNIDFSVGTAQTNLKADIQLIQVLFRIVHFEVSKPATPPPPGDAGIDITGKLDAATMRFLRNFQSAKKAGGSKILLDGVFDPFRAQGQLSLIAKVRYTLELLNNECFNLTLDDGSDAYTKLPSRTDIPSELKGQLNGPRRAVAKQYQR